MTDDVAGNTCQSLPGRPSGGGVSGGGGCARLPPALAKYPANAVSAAAVSAESPPSLPRGLPPPPPPPPLPPPSPPPPPPPPPPMLVRAAMLFRADLLSSPRPEPPRPMSAPDPDRFRSRRQSETIQLYELPLASTHAESTTNHMSETTPSRPITPGPQGTESNLKTGCSSAVCPSYLLSHPIPQ